jgi:hypothetical protein
MGPGTDAVGRGERVGVAKRPSSCDLAGSGLRTLRASVFSPQARPKPMGEAQTVRRGPNCQARPKLSGEAQVPL